MSESLPPQEQKAAAEKPSSTNQTKPNPKNDLPKNYDEWYELLEKTKKTKDDYFKIAICFDEGLRSANGIKIVGASRKDAFQNYDSAHLLGHEDATFLLGFCYENGQSDPYIPKNPGKAKIYYQNAAKKGHIEAAFRSGVVCEKLYGPQDQETKDFFKQAADKKHPEANFRLCQIYAGEENFKQAAIYAVRAHDLGHKDASPELIGEYVKQAELKEDAKNDSGTKPNPHVEKALQQPLKPNQPLSKL